MAYYPCGTLVCTLSEDTGKSVTWLTVAVFVCVCFVFVLCEVYM